MSVFLFTFLSLYSSLHIYFFFKAKTLFPFGIKAFIPLSFFLIFMVFSPIFVFKLEKDISHAMARVFAFVGFTWMGFIFLFFFSSVVFDLFSLVAHLLKKDFNSKALLYAPLILSSFCIAYGFYEAEFIRVKNLVIETTKLPLKENFTILHITDLHLGLTTRRKQVEEIFKVMEKEDVDLIISTGDIVDGNMEKYIPLFLKIRPKYGKFAVVGNHEFYRGIDKSIEFFEKAGFKVLRNEFITVGNLINIVGFDDPTSFPYGSTRSIPEIELLKKVPQNLFTIVLKHRPTIDKDSLGLFDLQLSGHTHKGQIFPFRYITRLFFPYYHGLFRLSKNSSLYVSSGAGTWGPPIRFLSPPEITVVHIVGNHLSRTNKRDSAERRN